MKRLLGFLLATASIGFLATACATDDGYYGRLCQDRGLQPGTAAYSGCIEAASNSDRRRFERDSSGG